MDRICRIYRTPDNQESLADRQTAPIPNPSLFPLQFEVIDIHISLGQTIVVAGPNGVGKSALLGEMARSIGHGDIVETFFGSRHIQFQSDEVDQVGQNLKQFQSQLGGQVTRFRHPWGEQHLKSVVRRVLNQDAQTNHDVVQDLEQGVPLSEAYTGKIRTIHSINGIFASARLPVRLLLEEGMLRAERSSSSYGIERLSDGERAALLVTGAVLIRPQNSFIVIDEPERHLHPGIAGPLLSALTRSRPDLGFVFSTHDLSLIEWLLPQTIIHLRSSELITDHPETRRYDLSLVQQDETVPEELRYAILGSRRRLLLVEGTADSADQALYGHLYAGWNVVSKGGWEMVATGVRALSRSTEYHWLEVAGLVDGDGRSSAEVAALAAEGIFTVPVPAIENLFLHPRVLQVMAEAAFDLFGGQTGADRMGAVEALLRGELPNAKDEIIARRTVWEANRLASANKISVQKIREGVTQIDPVVLTPILERVASEFDQALAGGSILDALLKIPLKNTFVPNRIAVILGFRNFNTYKQAVLRQIESETPSGGAIRIALQPIMPPLPTN